MLLVHDQYKQGNRKSFETESQLKQETSKQSFTGTWEGNHEWKSNFPKEIWGLSCEEELLASGIGTDEDDDNFFAETQEYAEDTRGPHRQFSTGWKKPYKNVRFEGPDFNYALDTSESSSMENEHPDGDDRGCDGRRRSLSQEPPVKMAEHLRASCKPRWRTGECYDKKYERRPKSSPEKSNSFLDAGLERRPMSLEEYGESMDQRQRMQRKEHRCGGRPSHVDVDVGHVCGELMNRKSRYKFECEDNFRRQRHGDYCDHRPLDDAKKNLSKPKSIHKHYMCHARDSLDDSILKGYKKSYRDNRPPQDKQFDAFAYHTTIEHCCGPDEFHGKGKKKVLEVVQEQEQYSDSTYKVSCTKASSHTMPTELMGYSRIRRSHEKLANSSQSDWLYCSGRATMDKLVQSHRLHKLRSRRTRMNRLKNGWKKAFVQTIKDGSRNERVGVIVMGPKGPEFYSKNTQQSTADEAFSNKNPETTQKSFEVMTVDCKNVYFSSFEPRTFGTNALPCPEDEAKVDEKLANFSKNVNEIVKTSEEKFYKSLSSNGYLEGDKNLASSYKREGQRDGGDEDQTENKEDQGSLKKDQYPLLPFETLSPRIPKSLRKRERKFTEESKAMADALNKQAQEYKESQLNPKDKDSYLQTLKHLQEEFPHRDITEETAKANLSVWGMKLEHLTERKDRVECVTELGNGDDGKMENDENPELTQDEISQTKLDQAKSSPRQKGKKTLEVTTPRKFVDNCAGDGAVLSQPVSEMANKRLPSTSGVPSQWHDSVGSGAEEVRGSNKDAEESLISEMFRDLVENGCAISKEEYQNLQSLFTKVNVETCSNDVASEASSEALINQTNESKEKTSATDGLKSSKGKESKNNPCPKEKKSNEKNGRETCEEDSDNCLGNANLQKMFKLKTHLDEKIFKKFQSKKKSKKKVILEDKMKALREALPSITAENEAAHLKQLKRYIDRFIERVEASTGSEFPKRKHNRHRPKDAGSTDSSEVRVDARKILDIVNNPFKTISSDVTINIAKKLTDALVQEKSNRSGKTFSGKAKKASEAETDDERLAHCDASSASGKLPPEKVRLKVEAFIREANFFAVFTCGILAVCGLVFLVKKYRWAETEPTYLKQLKKMRNQHLNNIVLEVKKLSDLLRFLDRCNRLTF